MKTWSPRMKRFLIATAVAGLVASIAAPSFAADVNVSVRIGDPDFYGRLDLGGYPPPEVMYREPLMVERIVDRREPIYLRVPPGHAKNWRKHCHRYGACGERVFFVRDDWYRHEYAPRYKSHWERREDRRDDRREDRRERWDDRRDDRRGPPPGDQWDHRPGDDRGRGRDR
jgi:hypothetical protein